VTEQAQTPENETQMSADEPPPTPAAPPIQPPPAPPIPPPPEPAAAASIAERPEVAVGAAFAGGFLLAMILKRFAR
jgi:hypothetical protein